MPEWGFLVTEIQMFSNGEFELRVTQVGESFTIEAPGLARALGFRDAYRLTESLPDKEKGYTTSCTPGGEQEIRHVTEAGFFRVISRRQPGRIKNEIVRQKVERFQDWVFGEVLPSIRRTGSYQLSSVPQPRQPISPFGASVLQPDVFTYDEVCAILRQNCGVDLGVNELTRYLRHAGILKQNGAPTARFKHLLWFTGSCWNVVAHMLPQLTYKVCETGRELQDFRFIQMRLELEGVGRPPEISPRDHRSIGT